MSEVRRDKSPTAERVPDELVDRFFDRELDEGSREKFFGMLRGDLSRCAEVAKTQRLVSMLREPIESPDLSGSILERIGRKRGFIPERLRRIVTASRLAAAALLLVGILGFALGRRYHPDLFRVVAEPQPVSDVIESGKSEAAVVVRPPAPMAKPAAPPMGKRSIITFAPGKTSVQRLPKVESSESIVVYGGAGPEARFVVEEGLCVDRTTASVFPVWTTGVPLGPALEEWIKAAGAGGCETAGTAAPPGADRAKP